MQKWIWSLLTLVAVDQRAWACPTGGKCFDIKAVQSDYVSEAALLSTLGSTDEIAKNCTLAHGNPQLQVYTVKSSCATSSDVKICSGMVEVNCTVKKDDVPTSYTSVISLTCLFGTHDCGDISECMRPIDMPGVILSKAAIRDYNPYALKGHNGKTTD